MRMIDADRMKKELLWGNVFLTSEETNVLVGIIDKQPTLTPQNEPLTPEELQGICGQPVFVVSDKFGNFWALVNMNSVYVDARKCFLFENFDAEYGKIWTAYRRPPERQEDTQ